MKLLVLLALFSISLTQELKVEGNLNVTGSMQSTTIDSLKQVIQQLEAHIASMQGVNKLETRVFETNILNNNDTINILNDLNLLIEQVDYYFLEIISIDGLSAGGGDYQIKVKSLETSQQSSAVFVATGYPNGFTYYPYYGTGVSHTSTRSIFTSNNLKVIIPNGLSCSLKLAITAQFPFESAATSSQQNSNKPLTVETK